MDKRKNPACQGPSSTFSLLPVSRDGSPLGVSPKTGSATCGHQPTLLHGRRTRGVAENENSPASQGLHLEGSMACSSTVPLAPSHTAVGLSKVCSGLYHLSPERSELFEAKARERCLWDLGLGVWEINSSVNSLEFGSDMVSW